MLIISKFHDYYDPVAKSKGIDKTIIYKRETLPIDCLDINMLRHSERYSRGDLSVLDFYTYVIGFCGKLYPIGLLNKDSKITLFHSFEAIKKSYLEIYLNQKRNSKRVWRTYNNQWTNRELNKLSDALKNKQLLELFQKYKVPVFVIGSEKHHSDPLFENEERCVLNPRLTNFKFEKVIDPYQAFQELEMFISGVLGVGERSTIKISDKNKIIEHGFDYKWSFRKEPTKKQK